MEISEVSGHAMSSPIDPPQERPFRGGTRTLHKRDVVLVVVETRDGERGYAPAGASSSAMREHFEDASQRAFADLIDGQVADALEGMGFDEPADAHGAIDDLDLPGVIASQAASAIDVALYDILGKRRGAPIHELLGDRGTTTLDLYASAGMYMPPEGYADQAAAIRDCGFAGYKYRPGIGPEGDRETFERLRDGSEDMAVMVDAHTWWKTRPPYGDDVVRELVSEWAGDAYWVEEPVAPDDYDGYRALADTGAALAGGESEASPEGLLALAGTGAVDFLQGDVRHHRGYTGCLEAVEHCNAREDVQFVPHHFGTLLGLVANAHLVAGAVDGDLLEYPVFENDPHLDAGDDPGMYPFELCFDVLEDDLTIDDGRMTVPGGPGLGVDVNEDVIEEYPFIEGAWTTFEYDDP